jgi:hypothetical protein
MKISQKFLVLTAVGLLPIALSYGAVPKNSLDWLFGIGIDGTNDTHIFRAIMGLYIALSAFWLLGAYSEKLTLPALYSLTVFMFGLAGGRILSLLVDGMPHWLLVVYFILEILFGVVGLVAIFQESKKVANVVV